MEPRCESAMAHGRGWRAAIGAAVALAAAVPSGGALTDDSRAWLPALQGAVVAGDAGALAVCAVAAAPACAGTDAVRLIRDLGPVGWGRRDAGGPACAMLGRPLGACRRFGPSADRPTRTPVWHVSSAPAALPHAAATPPGSLARTGTPIGPALAGLVLLAAGGFLSWTRARA
jgi:hypothetical protein